VHWSDLILVHTALDFSVYINPKVKGHSEVLGGGVFQGQILLYPSYFAHFQDVFQQIRTIICETGSHYFVRAGP
jgi:hypothetical protein